MCSCFLFYLFDIVFQFLPLAPASSPYRVELLFSFLFPSSSSFSWAATIDFEKTLGIKEILQEMRCAPQFDVLMDAMISGAFGQAMQMMVCWRGVFLFLLSRGEVWKERKTTW